MRKYVFEIAGRGVLFFVLLCLSQQGFAEDPGFPGGDPDVPVDGGVCLLLVAGIVYGVRKLKGTGKD